MNKSQIDKEKIVKSEVLRIEFVHHIHQVTYLLAVPFQLQLSLVTLPK